MVSPSSSLPSVMPEPVKSAIVKLPAGMPVPDRVRGFVAGQVKPAPTTSEMTASATPSGPLSVTVIV